LKITIDIDCTPIEARTFFGLPNLEPMQDALVKKMHERLEAKIDELDPEALMRLWLPGGLKGLGEMQERFFAQFLGGMAKAAGRRDEPG
jgi:hypothetical protein